MRTIRRGGTPLLALLLSCATLDAPPRLRALIVDGQSNHADWPLQTRMVRRYLEETGLFAVDVATTPPKGADLAGFRPDFARYDVVVSVYNGDPWPEPARRAFADFVRGGKGFVSVHAADNSFPGWEEYNRMIGLGGWYGRNERSGPYVYFEGGRIVRDPAPGAGGSHGVEHRFVVEAREAGHPILRGLLPRWLHDRDELYDRLRGPAENLTVLATAFSDKATGGSGRHEPVLMVSRFGEGRVFHTTLGHGAYSRECVGFIATLQRGAEWAATGGVTQRPPADFPDEKECRVRRFDEVRRDAVASLAYSPDGRTIATGGEDGAVLLRDARTGAVRTKLGAHSATVTSVAFSPDGRRLASTGRSVRFWNLSDGTAAGTLAMASSWPECVAFVPGGGQVELGGLWNESLSSLGRVYATRVAPSPDGLRAAAACADGTLKVWKRDGGGEVTILRGHTEPLDALSWRPDGARIATGGRDGRVVVWDAASGAALRTIEPKSGWINDVRYSPDGRLLAVAHSRLTLWDPETGALVSTPAPKRERMHAVAFSPDGRTIAWAGAESSLRMEEVPAR